MFETKDIVDEIHSCIAQVDCEFSTIFSNFLPINKKQMVILVGNGQKFMVTVEEAVKS